jgi:preprotein translocase subunit SecE
VFTARYELVYIIPVVLRFTVLMSSVLYRFNYYIMW